MMRRRGMAAMVALALFMLVAAPAAAFELTPAMDPGVEYAPDRVIVQYKGGADPAVLHVPSSRLERALRALQSDPAVEFAERDVVVHATAVTPNDPMWNYQWGPEQVGAPRAWSTTTGDRSVVVAVLDSGVDGNHEDLAGATVSGWNILTGTSDARDDNGHGTAAASIIAARTDNEQGVAGMCWVCAIMPVKILAADGSGFVSDLAAGIRWAVDHGASVVNMSVAGPASSRVLDGAIDHAIANDVILVASAGNEAVSTPTFPAAHEAVIGVGASDFSGERTTYSNHGSWVEVAAPGCNEVASATVEGGGYRSFCGTSSAAPVVAGLLGLARSAAPAANVAQLRGALTTTAAPLAWVRHGAVDAAGVVELLASAPTSEPTPAPTPQPTPTFEPEPVPSPETGLHPMADRLAGDNRFATAAAISAASRQPGVDRVYVGTGRHYPDALAAGPAAAAAGGPVLLTEPMSLPAATAQELARLQPREIVIAGGTASVSAAVEGLLARYGPVRRIAGADRYSTAAAIARDAFSGPVPVLYVASGRNFPDALAGGAAAAALGGPLLLTEPGRVPPVTAAAIRALQPQRIVVLGGTAAIASSALVPLTLLAGTVSRVSGENRFATASAVSRLAFPTGADVVYLATGTDFPDALAGGPAAATTDSPLLLVQRDGLPAATATELARLRPRHIVALGGRAAISGTTLQAARTVAGH